MRTKEKWLEWHFHTSINFAKARNMLRKLTYDKDTNSKLRRKLISISRKLSSPLSLLDDHYHELITNEEFLKWGHIYYNENGRRESRRASHMKSITNKA